MKGFLYILLFANCYLFSQDLKIDAEKINQFYSKHPNMSAEIDYNMYENYTSEIVYSKTTASVKKCNGYTYLKLEDMETIKCDDYTLLVDNENKNISLLPKKTDIKSDTKNFELDLNIW